MINDQQLAKVMRAAAKDQLYCENYNGEYLVSNTFMIFKVNPAQHKKTLEVVSGALMGLPEPGQVIAIRKKEKIENPNQLSRFLLEKQYQLKYELTDTGFLKEMSSGRGARVLVSSDFVTVVDNDFFNIAPAKQYRTERELGQVGIFDGDQYLGMILPIRYQDLGDFDVFLSPVNREHFIHKTA